ncbi:ABC transporter ATP-binding protein [Poseidonocella sp. HB161398]|uniref:ABC transporter ATP-binding protein n=1 Tax=Poseidonocella sp. HB161398 TaxID=2320855 RepID=UPI0011086FBF|nr:ABC transporter ATP-binding protein [Poseidonocella sp. HB161398]
MATLSLSAIGKSFGGADVIPGLDLDIAEGELVCLLGPSGSGKSTLLRMAGGFEMPDRGTVRIGGADVTRMPPEKRPTAMVFQSHALWSHMSVAGNIAFGLKLRRLPRAEIRSRVEAVLELVGLAGYGARKVWQLSGGQQQRVAIARALVLEPQILLLDEPFASLDQHLRERMREELRDIQQRLGITTLFVTHGQDEALALADRIVVLKDGRIEQADAPDVLYRAPATRFVAGFIGTMNFLACDIRRGRADHPLFAVPLALPDGPAELAIRPEALRLTPDAEGPVRVRRVTDYGSHVLADLETDDGERLKAHCPPEARPAPGQRMRLSARQLSAYQQGRRAEASPAHLREGALHA